MSKLDKLMDDIADLGVEIGLLKAQQIEAEKVQNANSHEIDLKYSQDIRELYKKISEIKSKVAEIICDADPSDVIKALI